MTVGESVLATAACLLVLLGLLAWTGRRQRMHNRRWAERYYRGGGLIRALMKGWQRTPRLTDQRDASDRQGRG